MLNNPFSNNGNSKISLRPITEADQKFLHQVYADSRAEEMKLVDWDDIQKTSFLKMQFDAQHEYYIKQFSDAAFDIIEFEHIPIGRLYVERRTGEIRIIDIALLTEYRNRGFGGCLLKGLLDEATTNNNSVSIHVEKNNPALSLYKKLGFIQVEDQGVYYLMKWDTAKNSLKHETS